MSSISKLEDTIFEIETREDFENRALEVFLFQYQHNKIYAEFVDSLGVKTNFVKSLPQIPCLPISFFKRHDIVSGMFSQEVVFTSSGTTGSVQSRHLVKDKELYERSFFKAFEMYFGKAEKLCIIGLLPSYLEREGSSLIYMVDQLIRRSSYKQSGFHLEMDEESIRLLEDERVPKVLFGVTFALLELAEKGVTLRNCQVIETGGMKGRGKELIREELHQILCKGLQVEHIYSEYGMTELLSQAYRMDETGFQVPPWMQVSIRDINDPLSYMPEGKTGGVNVIDLANLYSCAFIATDDLGKKMDEERFEVLGRFDHSDVRGCNLLVI